MFSFLTLGSEIVAFLKTLPAKITQYDAEKALIKQDIVSLKNAIEDLKTQISNIANAK